MAAYTSWQASPGYGINDHRYRVAEDGRPRPVGRTDLERICQASLFTSAGARHGLAGTTLAAEWFARRKMSACYWDDCGRPSDCDTADAGLPHLLAQPAWPACSVPTRNNSPSRNQTNRLDADRTCGMRYKRPYQSPIETPASAKYYRGFRLGRVPPGAIADIWSATPVLSLRTELGRS